MKLKRKSDVTCSSVPNYKDVVGGGGGGGVVIAGVGWWKMSESMTGMFFCRSNPYKRIYSVEFASLLQFSHRRMKKYHTYVIKYLTPKRNRFSIQRYWKNGQGKLFGWSHFDKIATFRYFIPNKNVNFYQYGLCGI